MGVYHVHPRILDELDDGGMRLADDERVDGRPDVMTSRHPEGQIETLRGRREGQLAGIVLQGQG